MNKFYGTEAVWGMGIVEDVNDPERAGRLRVRIYGIHNVDMNILPTDDLPWSQVLMPVNSAGLSGVGTSPVGAKKGSMVYGQFLDGRSMQQFLVMGTMPGKRARSEVQINNGEAPTTDALVGNSAAEQIYNFAKTRGLSEEMAAGIVGSIAHETRLRFDPTEDNGNGVGIGRFRGQELEELKNYASARGTTFEDLATQASFIVDKLTGQIPSDKVINFLKVTEDDAFVSTSVNPITTAAEASDAFTQIFYRESTTENAAARQEYARQATSAYGSTPNDADLGPFAPRVAADVVSKGSYIESTEHLYTHFRNTQRELTRLVVHHTDTYENMDTSVEDIDDWHKQRGWSEIGYHFVIRRDGRIQVGRDIEKTGAHARAGGFNRKSVGIAFVGGKVGSSRRGGNQRSKTTFTDKQWEAFDRFLSDWHRVFPNSQILGHNDTDRTHTDPEFDVAAYVAAKFSEWRRTTPVAPAQTPGQSGVQSSTGGAGEVTVEAPVVVDPVAVPQAAEPAAEPYSIPDIDTDGILEAPAGDIVLPEIDLGNFPSIPDIFEDVTGSITDISLGDIFGDSISSGASNGNSTLGGQSASYYLDFDNFINIPSPTITLGGDVTGSGTMTELGDVTINTTLSVTGTFAPLDSPAFIGSPTAPTATAGDSTTRIATTAYVQGEIASLGGGDVSVSGTPADNQLTVWTAADTVEGDANLTWDGATLAVTGNVEPGTDATYSLGASNKQWQDIYIDGTIYQDGVAYDLSTLGSGTEVNDLTAAVVWANVPDANITQSSVTQHQAALSITESQISDLGSYLTSSDLTPYATLASPTFTGTPAAPTATAGTNTTQVATTAFVSTAISDLVDAAPTTLDTLNELAAALGDDPNFATTVTTSIGTKWTQDNTKISNWDTAYSWGDHSLAGYLTSFTETNDLSAAVTWANVPDANITQSSVTQHQGALTIGQSQVTNLTADLAAKAPLASPALTGTPTAPTATSGTNTTQLATTAFVQAAVTGAGGGDVSKVGTPVDNQIGVWTGDGTIEGDSDFTWNGTTLYVSNSSDTLPALSLNSASDSSDAAPILDFVRTSASPDDGDYLGQIKFKGDNDTSGEVVYAKITGKTSDVTNGTEDGLIEFAVKANGANVIAARLTNSDFKLLNGHGITINGDLTFDGASSATVDRILDEDTMSSNSATALATQQSIKAYVDASVPPANTTASTTSTTQTSVYTFATATYHGAELVITANDTVAGERQIVKLVVTHDGTTAIATEYASIFTGTSALASFDVDINSGNVRLLVTSASTNNTDYVINATLL